jgi:glycosyltransferase involved in cell wall biosynthesis
MTEFRVLHVLESAQPRGTATVRIARQLGVQLAALGFQIEVCFLYENGPLAEELVGVGIPVHYWPVRGRGDIAGLLRFANAARKRHFDIIHTHVWSALICRLLKLVTNAKLVYHIHARGDETDWQGARRLRIPAVDKVVADSKAAGELSITPAEVLHPGVFSNGAVRGDEVFARPPIIGTAGRLVPIKGLPDLLQAFSQIRKEFPSLRLQILGEGPEQRSLKELGDALGIGSQVEFLGWLPDIRPIVSQWQVFALPSWDEAFSISTAEAMITGVPPVVTSVGGLRELVDDGVNGRLVPSHSPIALASAIRELLLDPACNIRFGNNAREKILRHFTDEHMGATAARIYREVLARS